MTGTRIGELPNSTGADVTAAAEQARAAQIGWAARPVEERADLLLAFHDAVLDRRDALVNLVQSGGGKARLSAAEEVLHVALTARYYGRTARRYLHAERGSGIVPMLTRIDRNYVPRGLVGVIAPWNYPLTMAISDGLAALVAGNAVLLKPDQQTPLVALAAVELLHSVGLEPDLWPVVHGEGSVAGSSTSATTSASPVDRHRAEGRGPVRGAADRLLAGARREEPAGAGRRRRGDRRRGAVRACFSNAGQLCVAAERIYVAEPVREAFTAAFVRRTQALRLGAALDYDHDMASLINADQLSGSAAHVEDARAKGATVLTGGQAGPTWVSCSTSRPCSAASPRWTRTPTRPSVRWSACTPWRTTTRPWPGRTTRYGLNGSVWTSDLERGRRVAGRLKCGTVNVNEGFAATFGSLDAPMGGMKSRGSVAARDGTGSTGSSRCSPSARRPAADRPEPRPEPQDLHHGDDWDDARPEGRRTSLSAHPVHVEALDSALSGSASRRSAAMSHPDHDLVVVIDFGAQYAQLIARRVREARVYSEIMPHTATVAEITARRPKAVILSGGPQSVYAPARTGRPDLFAAGVPTFGICYGFQAMAGPWRRRRQDRAQ